MNVRTYIPHLVFFLVLILSTFEGTHFILDNFIHGFLMSLFIVIISIMTIRGNIVGLIIFVIYIVLYLWASIEVYKFLYAMNLTGILKYSTVFASEVLLFSYSLYHFKKNKINKQYNSIG